MRNARHIMLTYRKFIIEHKNKHNRDLISKGKSPSKRCMRSLIHYTKIINAYRKAKQAVITGEEMVNDFEPRSDICTEKDCTHIAMALIQCPYQKCREHKENQHD